MGSAALVLPALAITGVLLLFESQTLADRPIPLVLLRPLTLPPRLRLLPWALHRRFLLCRFAAQKSFQLVLGDVQTWQSLHRLWVATANPFVDRPSCTISDRLRQPAETLGND